ncbi:MAG TPA: VWA domain-containing protein [Terriglobales bacterium]|nr:VWA domain-containing protein [Terriglobales bacterium]
MHQSKGFEHPKEQTVACTEKMTLDQWIRKALGGVVVSALLLAVAAALAQDQAQKQAGQQNIPDAPSAVRPVQPFPTNLPPSRPQPESEQPAPTPAKPGSSTSSQPAAANEGTPPPPMPRVNTVPPGSVPRDQMNTREDLYTYRAVVNFVMVPVTVKDGSGHMVDGLLPNDFSVFEDGKKQELKFFTSDPFPLSAAIILDTGMPDTAVQKINQTYSSLSGAFSPYDEVSLYTYSSTVSQVSDFSSTGQKLTSVLNQMKLERGRNNGAPVMNGPLGPQGPTVNGIPVERPGAQPNIAPPKDVRVLNDAILRAALDLGKRDRARRKIIFIISDGREYGSRVSYSDVLKVLLSREISVYAIGVEGAAIPVYNKLEKFRLPHYGYTNILPKYTAATGGEVFTELTRDNIEVAYARATGDARNQYTLGYTTRATPSSAYRDIEVRVGRPGLKISAKSGYYPLPTAK